MKISKRRLKTLLKKRSVPSIVDGHHDDIGLEEFTGELCTVKKFFFEFYFRFLIFPTAYETRALKTLLAYELWTYLCF